MVGSGSHPNGHIAGDPAAELADIQRRFTYHSPGGPKDQAKHEKIRGDALVLAQNLLAELPTCRERSLAITKLEEFVFWANAALARHRT